MLYNTVVFLQINNDKNSINFSVFAKLFICQIESRTLTISIICIYDVHTYSIIYAMILLIDREKEWANVRCPWMTQCAYVYEVYDVAIRIEEPRKS